MIFNTLLFRRACSTLLLVTLLSTPWSQTRSTQTSTLAPTSKKNSFSRWIYIGETLREKDDSQFEVFPRKDLSRSKAYSAIAKMSRYPDLIKLNNDELKYFFRLISKLKKLLAANSVYFFRGGTLSWEDYLIGNAEQNRVALEKSFFETKNPLARFLHPALLVLAARAYYWSLSVEEREKKWTLLLPTLLNKLFGSLEEFDSLVWDWQVKEMIRFSINKSKAETKKKRSSRKLAVIKKGGAKPNPLSVRLPEQFPQETFHHQLAMTIKTSAIKGLKGMGQMIAGHFNQGKQVVLLGLNHQKPNEILTLNKMASLMWHTLEECQHPLYIVIQIAKHKRAKIKGLLEKIQRTGSLSSEEEAKLIKALQSREKAERITTLFKLVYAANKALSNENKTNVIVIEDFDQNSPTNEDLFRSLVMQTIKKNPQAKILFLTPLCKASRSGGIRQYLSHLLSPDKVTSIFVSKVEELDGSWVGDSISSDLKSLGDFALPNLSEVSSIQRFIINAKHWVSYRQFDSMILFKNPNFDDDGGGGRGGKPAPPSDEPDHDLEEPEDGIGELATVGHSYFHDSNDDFDASL